MSDNILNLPVNEYHIPTENEIHIMNTLFATPQLPIRKFLYNTLYASLFVTFINLIYLKYFCTSLKSHVYILLSFFIFIVAIYYIQVFNHDL